MWPPLLPRMVVIVQRMPPPTHTHSVTTSPVVRQRCCWYRCCCCDCTPSREAEGSVGHTTCAVASHLSTTTTVARKEAARPLTHTASTSLVFCCAIHRADQRCSSAVEPEHCFRCLRCERSWDVLCPRSHSVGCCTGECALCPCATDRCLVIVNFDRCLYRCLSSLRKGWYTKAVAACIIGT
jgi:hypothetical protein